MTPVEERIDHDLLAGIAWAWSGEVEPFSEAVGMAAYQDIGRLARAYQQLLTEHSAREERERELLRHNGELAEDVANARSERNSATERASAREEALTRAVYIAKNLLGMIPREVWRNQGGDDGQGHYEGDYYAERVATELDELAAALPATESAQPEDAPLSDEDHRRAASDMPEKVAQPEEERKP